MKKSLLIIAIVLGIVLGASAQNGGLFGKGPSRNYDEDYNNNRSSGLLSLPNSHGETDDVNAPLGGGAVLLIGFSAAYALKKRRDRLNHIPPMP